MSDFAEIIDEVRAQVAAGATVDVAEVEARIRAVGGRGQKEAIDQLRRVTAIQRARARLEREP